MPANLQQIWYLIFSLTFSAIILVWWHKFRRRQEIEEKPQDTRWQVVPLAGAAVLMLAMGLWNGQAIYMADESMYLLSAGHYANLQWAEPSPPIGNGEGQMRFEDIGVLYLMASNGRMYAIYPPGWPLVLAAMRQIMPVQLVSPVLGIGILLLVWWYGKRFLPSGATEGTLWVLGLTAAFTLNCVGFTSHPVTGLLLLGAAYFTERCLQTERQRDAVFAMLLCGFATSSRPLTGVLGIAIAGFFLWRRFGWMKTALFSLAALAVAGPIQLAQNLHTTGLWTQSPYTQFQLAHSVNFDYGRPFAWIMTARVAHMLACMFPLTIALAGIALWKKETRNRSLAYIGIWVITMLAHGISPLESDSPVGERYFFESMLFIAMAAGMGWAHVSAWAGPRYLWAMRTVAVLLAAVPIYNLSLHHHDLRAPHALLLEKMEELGQDADLVFLTRGPVLHSGNYWMNPMPWSSAKTVFWRTPRNETPEQVAQKLGRRRWKEVGLDSTGKQFVELSRSNP